MKLIDFSKYRKGSRPFGRVIDRCPKCGRKGQKTIYPHDNEICFAHKGYMQFGTLVIDEHCTLSEKCQ